jgi:hypothetical protein
MQLRAQSFHQAIRLKPSRYLSIDCGVGFGTGGQAETYSAIAIDESLRLNEAEAAGGVWESSEAEVR